MPIADADAERINAALRDWRQGDVSLGDDHEFAHIANLEYPLTKESEALAAEAEGNQEVLVTRPIGFVVVSQTCDIVRDCRRRPFIEVSPLVRVSEQELDMVRRRQRTNYAYLPGIAAQQLVADLDRTLTVEKGVAAMWIRREGVGNDVDIRLFAEALARRRQRFAFPDDFSEEHAKDLHKRIKDKHNRNSDEGKHLRALREIRVRAAPSWNSPKVNLEWWFIKEHEPEDLEDTSKGWTYWIDSWLALLPKSTKYKTTWHQLLKLEDMTALDYVESDRLDFDHLSD